MLILWFGCSETVRHVAIVKVAAISRNSIIVVMPDTQYAACCFPETFRVQTEWIRHEKQTRNIAAVLHVGDIVDHPFARVEWEIASSAMRALDGVLPYVLVPGNHDVGADRATLINHHFNPVSMSWIAGTAVAGHIENSYMFINISGRAWLVMGLEYSPREDAIRWANQVLRAHADLSAILLTHAYLDGADGIRYHSSAQAFYPEGGNDGEQLWQKVVVPNRNVRLVLCGHYGIAHQTSVRPDGSRVHEIVSDYQWWKSDQNNNGYLRLMEFDYKTNRIRVQTYSPVHHSFLTGNEHQFTLSLER
jgi:3',5'-cyclic AMP phosphodiesterase CpdA